MKECVIRILQGIDHIQLVPQDEPLYQGSSHTIRKEVIDLSVPRQISNYDKFGSRNMLISVKILLFGSKNIRLTKERCEEFFEDDRNFETSKEFRQEMDRIWR